MILTALEKKIIVLGFFAIIISTTIVYIFQKPLTIWLGLNQTTNESSNNDPKPTLSTNNEKDLGVLPLAEGPATISIKTEGQGTASIWLNLKKPHRISGIELIFSVNKSIKIEEITCETSFICITNKMINSKLVLAGYRPLDKIDRYLSNTIKIGTFKYNTNATGELVLNYNTTKPSIITQTGSGINLLTNKLHIYSLEKPQ